MKKKKEKEVRFIYEKKRHLAQGLNSFPIPLSPTDQICTFSKRRMGFGLLT